MKKPLIIILSLVLGLLLAACGNKEMKNYPPAIDPNINISTHPNDFKIDNENDDDPDEYWHHDQFLVNGSTKPQEPTNSTEGVIEEENTEDKIKNIISLNKIVDDDTNTVIYYNDDHSFLFYDSRSGKTDVQIYDAERRTSGSVTLNGQTQRFYAYYIDLSYETGYAYVTVCIGDCVDEGAMMKCSDDGLEIEDLSISEIEALILKHKS